MPKPVILCVDDDKTILDSLKIQLRSAFGNTYRYEQAENAEEALELIEELADEEINIMVIVSDWLMPGMKGDELLIKVHSQFPNIIKIMLTGQANDDSIKKAFEEAHLHSCLHKPWTEDDFIKTLKSALTNL